VCDVAVQDLSYLQHGRYAALLDSWIAAAEQIDGKQIGKVCQVQQGQSGMTNHPDLVVKYSNLDHYTHLALQLSPMMIDLMVRVFNLIGDHPQLFVLIVMQMSCAVITRTCFVCCHVSSAHICALPAGTGSFIHVSHYPAKHTSTPLLPDY
jgi:hypothetical protein